MGTYSYEEQRRMDAVDFAKGKRGAGYMVSISLEEYHALKAEVVTADDDKIILSMDRASAITISRALKTFYDSLYSGDQAGRIQRAMADYIGGYINEALALTEKSVTSEQKGITTER